MSNKEAEDAYRVLYRHYDRIMKHHEEYQNMVKELQKEILAQTKKKYPKLSALYDSLEKEKQQREQWDRFVENGV